MNFHFIRYLWNENSFQILYIRYTYLNIQYFLVSKSSAGYVGSGLLKTSLKCSFYRSRISDSLEMIVPSLLLTTPMFFDWSLHSFLVTYTFYILPVCAAFSASFAKSSVHVRLSLLILFFTSLSFLLYSTYPFFYPFRSYSMHLFLQLFPSTLFQLSAMIHSWCFLCLGPRTYSALSL